MFEKVFFPKCLDYAFAGFSPWRWGLAFGESRVFHAFGDCGEYAIDSGLQLILLAFDFEFYVADFHFDFDGWPLRVLCQVDTC